MRSYYIDNDGQKNGPYDLVTIMRRIRSGKINKNSLIFYDDESTPKPAYEIEEIAFFFDNTQKEKHNNEAPLPSFWKIISWGWQLVSENHITTAYAGGMLLLCLMLSIALVEQFGLVVGSMVSWVFLVLLHNLYFIFILRLYRGQTIGSYFLNKNLSPILLPFIITSIILALMMAGGLFLFVIPGIIIAIIYIFTPFLMLDRGYKMAEAMYASRLLLQKRGRKYLLPISLLVLAHLLFFILIIPIPLTLPIFAAAISAIYEEIISY